MTDMESSATKTRVPRWSLAPVDDVQAAALASATGLSLVVARILCSRGVCDEHEATRFLRPELDLEWSNPSLIPGMDEAAARVAQAVRDHERILVFGDFDLDGISSAALATRGLRALGADVSAIVPNRFGEGYGLSDAAIRRALTLQPQLLMTVDCGVSSAVEVEALRAAGVDVVVTDHHEPGSLVPRGVPVANPKLDEGCGSCDLAGAGVALKLIHAVGDRLGQPELWRDLVDLAMLGTIADIVPLRGQNRALVAAGLARSRSSPRIGIAALASVAGSDIGQMNSDTVAFALAPRLNAAGRMADPAVALELLLTDDPGRAEELALGLDEQNRIRQSVEQDLSEAALALAERTYRPGERALVLAGEGWHAGVKGIVASRLTALYGVPAVLFAIEDGEAVGSGRSVGDVDLHAAVSALSDMLTRYGGHEAAVGVTLPASDVNLFRTRLLDELDRLPAEAFVSRRTCDAEIELEHVSVELAAELSALEPFGHENPRPLLCSRAVFMNARQRVGRTANHLRFTAYDGVATVPAIAFRCRDIERLAECDAAVDLAYEIVADEWRGRRRVQLQVREFDERVSSAPYAPAAELVEDLFAHADEILAREEYTGIGEAESFHTKLAGVTFEGRQEVVAALTPGLPLRLDRQPENPHDANAIALFDPYGHQVGFFNRRLAAVLAPVLDSGVEYDVEVADVTGGDAGRSLGLNVRVARRSDTDEELVEESRAQRRSELAELPAGELGVQLTTSFIGDRQLHDAQVRALEALAAGRRTMCVMATGRGKSLIFHLHAARTAIRSRKASVFVFPLRALVADQAFHLEEVYAGIGLNACTLTGESAPTRRDDVFGALSDGSLDVVLTTPEFFEHHAGRFAATGRVGFVVVDEAHHVGTARSGHRPAYSRLGSAIDMLGSPDVLAVSATVDRDVGEVIRGTLGITEVIEDPTVRENLIIEDRRGVSGKDDILCALAARDEKVVVYVNSREQSVQLARMLRKRVPAVALRTAFYNGGLGKAARHAVERAFRVGDITVVIATSAFGEGVNIPDIRHVVLYHLPFNDIEFNQMSGRAGRDGAPSRIHLLFGPRDGRVNEMVLAAAAPSRDDMAAVYAVLAKEQAATDGAFELTNAEIADRARAARKGCSVNERGASTAISVFRELDLVHGEGYGAFRRLTVAARPQVKVELSDSVRYAEGILEKAEFDEFREWVLSATSDELLARFNRPILPSTL